MHALGGWATLGVAAGVGSGLVSDRRLPSSLVVANAKGGVGKTTITAHLAISAAARGHDVVAVDLDPQGNLTTELGIASGEGDGGRSLAAMAAGALQRPALVATSRTGLRCLPGGPGTTQFVRAARRHRGEHGMREVLIEALGPLVAGGATLFIDTHGAAATPLAGVALERAQGIRVDLSAPGLAEDEPVPIGSPYGRALLEAGLHERRAQRFQEVARADQELYQAFVPSLEEMRAFAIELAEDGDGRVTEQLERRDFSTAAFLRSVRAGSAAAEAEGHRWDECVTPGSIVRRTRDLLGAIELDPCADSKLSVGAERSLTRADDGLEQSWAARGLLVHPPYSRIAEFVEKLVRERATGHTGEAVLVLPAPVEDHLWQASWWPLIESQPMCLLGERFRDERSPYPLTMVSYAGERRDEFVAAFRGLGPIFSAHGGERR